MAQRCITFTQIDKLRAGSEGLRDEQARPKAQANQANSQSHHIRYIRTMVAIDEPAKRSGRGRSVNGLRAIVEQDRRSWMALQLQNGLLAIV